jgi:hypothetical protein
VLLLLFSSAAFSACGSGWCAVGGLLGPSLRGISPLADLSYILTSCTSVGASLFAVRGFWVRVGFASSCVLWFRRVAQWGLDLPFYCFTASCARWKSVDYSEQ